METITGDSLSLSEFHGKVLLVVNVASKCGFTPQYEGLQEIYEKYSEQGFAVLGFPANNFANQEPGTDSDIQEFCSTNYGVTFPMFSKISVKGEDQHPLYTYLTSEETNPEFAGEITWNFNKFLIGKDGQILNRFKSKDKPQSDKVIKSIKNALQSS
ncbi:MAG: glutathione peroxidase [Candidatus Marinimicrobia bacterium]|nr:glutathione peroxidase [Candidatus Neomarinimicrobiota bacterium]MCF7827443.1 glutathione peroxidase [Candidatus Neomarinimicrobiota bacterium]MCF7882318.1 glutathione peroxidase [Candidatus Neomarinimicrobiota bacterium]